MCRPLEAQTENYKGIFSEFHWNNRLLIVFTPSLSHLHFLEQKKIIEQNKDGFKDREIVVIEITDKGVFTVNRSTKFPFNSSAIRSQFGIDEKHFFNLLIGKDGTIKYENPFPSDPCHLFDLIDSMPMRRIEITKGAGSRPCIKNNPRIILNY